MKPLTARQRDVLRVIASFHAQNGYMPTVRELCPLIGVTGTNAVNDNLLALERKGALWRAAAKARAMRITDQGFKELD